MSLVSSLKNTHKHTTKEEEQIFAVALSLATTNAIFSHI
jgi:hypothetical protein